MYIYLCCKRVTDCLSQCERCDALGGCREFRLTSTANELACSFRSDEELLSSEGVEPLVAFALLDLDLFFNIEDLRYEYAIVDIIA